MKMLEHEAPKSILCWFPAETPRSHGISGRVQLILRRPIDRKPGFVFPPPFAVCSLSENRANTVTNAH